MPRYLTPEWLEAAQHALDTSATISPPRDGASLTVQQVVTGGPDGDVAYHLHVDHGVVRLIGGTADDPTVTFTQSWDTASAISRGELSAQGAFMTGLIRVRGDLPRLVAHSDLLDDVGDVLADLRSQTTY